MRQQNKIMRVMRAKMTMVVNESERERIEFPAQDDGEEGEGGYTTLYYQISEDENSDEIDMTEVVRLMDEGEITDETLCFCDGASVCPTCTAVALTHQVRRYGRLGHLRSR